MTVRGQERHERRKHADAKNRLRSTDGADGELPAPRHHPALQRASKGLFFRLVSFVAVVRPAARAHGAQRRQATSGGSGPQASW